jgi:hypothetical protein
MGMIARIRMMLPNQLLDMGRGRKFAHCFCSYGFK